MSQARSIASDSGALIENAWLMMKAAVRILLFAFWTIFCFLLCAAVINRRLRSRVGTLWGRVQLRVFGFEVRLNKKIEEKGAVIVPTHSSYLDIPVVFSLFRGVFVATTDIKNWPFFGWGNTLVGAVYVTRGKRGMVAHLVEQGSPILQHNDNLFIFAEGRSSRTPVLPLKRGAFVLAAHNKAPIVPVTIRYGDLDKVAWAIGGPNSGFRRHVARFLAMVRKERVTVTVLPTLYADQFEDDEALRKTLRDAMQRVYDDESLHNEDLEAMDLYGLQKRNDAETAPKAEAAMG